MIKTSDFKVGLSSIEFSLFCQQPQPRYCPSCGVYLPSVTFGEIASRYVREPYFRFSSVILILGVGSLVCYKMYMQKKMKRKKSTSPSSSCIAFTYKDPTVSSSNENNLIHHHLDSIYFEDHEESPSYTVSYEPSESEIEQYFAHSLEKFISKQSLFSSPSSIIGTDTVAKLDQLLQQIEEIKESVGELNADLLETKKLDCELYGKRSSTSSSYDESGSSILGKDDLQTPSLEWDPNDIKLYSESDNCNASEMQLKTISSSSAYSNLASQLSSFKSFSSASEISSGSESSCSSQINFTEQDVCRIQIVQDLIDEARRQGLLPDLMRFLLKNSQRDSAYFED